MLPLNEGVAGTLVTIFATSHCSMIISKQKEAGGSTVAFQLKYISVACVVTKALECPVIPTKKWAGGIGQPGELRVLSTVLFSNKF